MNDVRPLVFLLGRSIVNGVKRAVTSPKRLIGLTFFLFYYWSIFLRPFSSSHSTPLPIGGPRLTMWPAETLDAVVFGGVGALSLFLMASVLSYKGGFKAADVDVLFPTPVSPRVVLLFRIARDTLTSLFIPLIVGVFGYRGGSEAFRQIFRNYPERGGDILRAAGLAYLLVAVAWVCIGYAASLFVNRSDLDSDRYRKRINALLGGLFLALALFVAIQVRNQGLSLETYVGIAHAPLVRVILAPVTLATWFVMGLFAGKLGVAAAGLLGLALIVGLSLRVALTQVGWMYDQAAVRGFDTGANLRDLQRKGDMIGIQAERARQGKLKHGRIARRIANLRVRGPMALLWKEAILQARGSLSGLAIIAFVFIVGTGMLMWSLQQSVASPRSKLPVPGWAMMGMQGMIVYTLCMASANGGFIELLRRVDVQKPLPFTPAATVFWETVAKAVAPTLLGFLCAVVGTVINPSVWSYALAGSLMAPSLAVLLSAVVLLVILLFPDIEDPTQRAFRGLMMMLGIALSVALGAAVLGVGIYANVSPLILAPVVFAINLGITAALSVVSGTLYANFNPSE